MRVLTVIGNRPQFIKASAVSSRLRARGEEVTVHTGQHYDAELSQVFFDELELPPPEHLLGIGGGTNTKACPSGNSATACDSFARITPRLCPGPRKLQSFRTTQIAPAFDSVALSSSEIPEISMTWSTPGIARAASLTRTSVFSVRSSEAPSGSWTATMR